MKCEEEEREKRVGRGAAGKVLLEHPLQCGAIPFHEADSVVQRGSTRQEVWIKHILSLSIVLRVIY